MVSLKLHHSLIFYSFQMFILTIMLSIMIFVGITVAPMVEGNLFPVVEGMTIKKVGADYYQVEGDKVRPCTYLGMEGLIRTKTSIVKADFSFTDSNSSRPVGRQSFGTWRIEPEGELISLFVRHNCHSLWSTTTRIK